MFAVCMLAYFFPVASAGALTFSASNLNVFSGSYFTWGAPGVSGYGIRDNAGTLEFKNSGGSWASLNTIMSNFCASGGCSGGSSTAWSSITGKPYPVNGQTWNWSGQSGQPSWLWGSNDSQHMYVWNPANFNVNYANSAGVVAWSGVSGKSGTFTGSSFQYCGQYMNFSGGLATGNGGSYNCGGADIAERYPTDGYIPVERGHIVAFSTSTASYDLSVTNPAVGEGSTTPYVMTVAKVHVALPGERSRIIGAVPTRAFDIGGEHANTEGQLVTLAGHVPLHVTLEGGVIEIGDPITLSPSRPGYGTKAVSAGRIVGYALAPFAGIAEVDRGSDMIEVFVHLDEWHPAVSTGFTMMDEVTGDAHCVVLRNGAFVSTRGACH